MGVPSEFGRIGFLGQILVRAEKREPRFVEVLFVSFETKPSMRTFGRLIGTGEGMFKQS